MATYRILRKNSIFKGFPGDEIIADPGALMDASVRSGIVQRIDVQKAENEVTPKPKTAKGKKGDKDN